MNILESKGENMSKRDAIDTITGYFYQFDYTIFKILELTNPDNLITIEGIEDIDVNSINEETAIQCKYYSKTEYNHSIIAKPIRLMLNHFKEVKLGSKTPVKYYLYGHYKKGQEKLVNPITIDFLKESLLTYTKDKIIYYHYTDLHLTDKDLEDFLSNLTVDINAVDYVTQLDSIFNTLTDVFQCSKFEAEHYYYNNALKVIKELATQNDIANRKISKKEFLSRINNKQVLFNEWFVLIKGKQALLRSLRSEYFTNLNTSPFERFFLIELDNNEYSRGNLKELILLISDKWSNISKRNRTPYCPYIYLHNIQDSELIEIKNELYEEGYKFLDGYTYMGSPFNVKAICEVPSFSNKVTLKIINNLNDLDLTINQKGKTREIYQFYKSSPPFFDKQNDGIKHVKIQYEQFKDIKEVI